MMESQISTITTPRPPVKVSAERGTYDSSLRRNPYRLFFPFGILSGLFGVGLWIPWSFGLNHEGINLRHSLIQSQAFLAFFAAGFLMTAFPWMSGTASATAIEFLVSSAAAFVFVVLALSGLWIQSELVFLLFVISICSFVGRRILRRTKNQPSFFFLLGCGLVSALCGTGFILLGLISQKFYGIMSVGRQMMQLGFMLFLVMGVTHDLGPFILGRTHVPLCHSGGGQSRRGLFCQCLLGATLFLSFFVDPYFPRSAAFLRALLVTVHQVHYAQIWRPIQKKSIVNIAFLISCWTVPLGLWTVFLFPQFKVAGLHLVFIGGFGLMILSFGLLVVINHSARKEDLFRRLPKFKMAMVLVLFAALIRFFADVFNDKYVFLIRTSAVLWGASSLFWLVETRARSHSPQSS